MFNRPCCRWLLGLAALSFGLTGCQATPSNLSTQLDRDPFQERRRLMVLRQIEARGIQDARVLRSLRRVPRHRLVPESLVDYAYYDRPLPIGFDQTISQPYIVALMSEALAVGPGARVLEVGTGSGYQAAVLAEMGATVFTVEIVPELAERASNALAQLGYDQVTVRHGDGYIGWEEEAPFDGIVVTAAPEQVPQALLDQLAEGGRLIIPVGRQGANQQLRLYHRQQGKIQIRSLGPVRFVPFTRLP